MEDYDSRGRIRLGAEYAEWLASGDNWLASQAVSTPSASLLRIIFPLPGTTVYLDPDLPEQGRRLRLRAEGSPKLEWASDSLKFVQEGAKSVALLTAGRHQLTARDPLTGAEIR